MKTPHKFSQQWIDCDHEQPPLGDEVLLKTDKGIAIGLRITDTKYNAVSMHGSFGIVTHWMPIDFKEP